MEQHIYDNIHNGEANHQGHSMATMHYDQQHTANLTSSTSGDEYLAEMPAMMMMKMYFHFGLGDMVLFKSLVVDSQVKMWATCLVLFLCAILLEAIDYSRGYLSCRCREATQGQASRQTSDAHLIEDEQNNATQTQMTVTSTREWSCCSGPNVNANNNNSPKFFPVRTSDPPLMRLVQSVLQVIRTTLALGLMLVVMTYNLCLIFPILLGSGFGFFLFYRPATLDSKGAMCH